jgi:hypothetical protein
VRFARIAVAIVTTALGVTTTAATAAADTPAPGPNPLARDYVDIGIHFGPAWRANIADGRYAPFGLGGGVTIDIGRAPYWGGIYSDVAIFTARDGVVDPKTNDPPEVSVISAGWRAKIAIRLTPRIYLFPALGAGFGHVGYASGHWVASGVGAICNCNSAAFDGFSAMGEATFAYVWRYGAVTFQPLRVNTFLGMSNRSAAVPAGYDYGVAHNGLLLAATIGVSVDPAAMVLALRDAIVALIPRGSGT